MNNYTKIWQELVNKIYWNTRFNSDKISIWELYDLSNFVKDKLQKKWKEIYIKYWNENISWKINKRLHIQWVFFGLNAKWWWYVNDSAWIRTETEEKEKQLFSEPIIQFLKDLKDISELKNESRVHNWAYWGKNW